MEKIFCMSIIYFVDISSQDVKFMKSGHIPSTNMDVRMEKVCYNLKSNTYLILGAYWFCWLIFLLLIVFFGLGTSQFN